MNWPDLPEEIKRRMAAEFEWRVARITWDGKPERAAEKTNWPRVNFIVKIEVV